MLKRVLTTSLLLAGISVFAQTPRLSLFEEFTGETCPPCAATNPGLNLILASPTNTPKVVAIKWQVPIPSAPSPTWSLYKTNQAEIDWRYKSTTAGGYGYPSQWNSTSAITSGINAAPTGLFDGQHQWVFGAANDHPANVTNGIISTAQSFTSAFSITMTRAWDNTFSSVNLTITVLATANFTATGSLIFRTVMVEKYIHFPTQPGTNGEKDFEDVAIKSFPTLQGGVPMLGAWTNGQNMTFTLNCPLPAYTRDKAEVAFVGFIQDDGNRRVAQAVRANPQPLQNDAKAVSAAVQAITCGTSITPTITVKNMGSNAISAFTVTPMINAVPQTNFVWTGNLAIGASTTIVLPTITGVLPGKHTFNYDIISVSGTDNNLLNNKAATAFIVEGAPQTTPIVEGFVPVTFPPVNWVTWNASPSDPTWFRTTSAGGFGLSTQSTKLDLYNQVADGAVNELILPPYDFTITSGQMVFDVAYAQWQNSQDQLEVLVSSDCGQSWTVVYNKQGSTLSTTGSSVSAAFTPGAAQWRKEKIILNNMQLGNTLVKFRATSDYGNNMYIDNVNLQQCAQQTLNVTATKQTICQGESVTLNASGATSYSWSVGSQTTQAITVTPVTSTTYSVFSTDATACPGTFTTIALTVSNCTGLQTAAITVAHQVFPNPNSGEFTLTADVAAGTLMNVYNAIGQKVFEQVLTGKENHIKANLAKGVYHYELMDAGQNIGTGKLVIE